MVLRKVSGIRFYLTAISIGQKILLAVLGSFIRNIFDFWDDLRLIDLIFVNKAVNIVIDIFQEVCYALDTIKNIEHPKRIEE